MKINRREFLKTAAAVGVSAALPSFASAMPKNRPSADSMVLIWLPGGIAQTDTWDFKKHTPYEPGMKGNQLLGTCPALPTSVDGIVFGQGLENMAMVMDKGALLRSLVSDTKFGAIHLKAQYYAMTGYIFPSGVRAPSIGSVVARSLGRKEAHVPPYIYIGRDIDTSDSEKLFISEYLGPGFYGVNWAPFMIPDPAAGLSTLYVAAGVGQERLDRRQALLNSVYKVGPKELNESAKAADYMKVMADARAMMDSPVKKAFDFLKDEKQELIDKYQGEMGQGNLLDKSYYYGNRFGNSLLLARRLIETGARFIQVEYQYGPFKGWDMHENGRRRMVEMKRQVDRPIATFLRDMDARGLLDRTVVCIMTEFGRTIASEPAAGTEPDGFAERHTGEKLTIANEQMYGFHGHFSSCNCMLFFGGGFKRGFAYGKTADRHPMVAVEKPVHLIDCLATIYKALGIPADHSYVTEGRPFYVTKDAKGEPVGELLV
jgi:hypothetical protein